MTYDICSTFWTQFETNWAPSHNIDRLQLDDGDYNALVQANETAAIANENDSNVQESAQENGNETSTEENASANPTTIQEGEDEDSVPLEEEELEPSAAVGGVTDPDPASVGDVDHDTGSTALEIDTDPFGYDDAGILPSIGLSDDGAIRLPEIDDPTDLSHTSGGGILLLGDDPLQISVVVSVVAVSNDSEGVKGVGSLEFHAVAGNSDRVAGSVEADPVSVEKELSLLDSILALGDA